MKAMMTSYSLGFYEMSIETKISTDRLIDLTHGLGYGVTNAECEMIARAFGISKHDVIEIALGRTH
jgi:hypothetical protein